MITPDYCRTMARYNRWQNTSLMAAAESLEPAERVAPRGAFFGSILGTLSHLLWADAMWMSRFDGGARPAANLPESAAHVTDWAELAAERRAMDDRIDAWAASVTADALAGDLAWFSGAAGRDATKPVALCVAHFFNHQTHHRGQVHAMLTAAGATPEATDLFLMPDGIQ